ncbi:MAG: FHA domain-containing protein [Candidatus Brocadiae bacterium]|nr:FHA domain-containing protein [Candidatus Brocadiia bacterium]
MPIIRVKAGAEVGRAYDITNEVLTIGRDPSALIKVMDHGVSRQHAEIFKIGEMCFIRDLKSTNGTFVNDGKVSEELLRAGDQVRIGNTVMTFEDGGETGEESKKVDFDQGRDLPANSTIELKLDRTAEKSSPPERVGKEIDHRNLAALYDVARIIGTEKDSAGLLNKILELAMQATNADTGYMLLLEKGSGKLVPKATMSKEKTEPKISRTIVKRVVQHARAILTSDAMLDSRFAGSESIVMKNIKSVLCAPMVARDRITGILYLHSSKVAQEFSSEDLEVATAIALQGGIAANSFQAAEVLRKTLVSFVKTLVSASEMRDPRTQGHADRVANFAAAIGHQMKLPKGDLQRLHLAALLHDVGKMGQPVEMPEGGNHAQWRAEHVHLGEKIVSTIEGFEDVLPGVKHHHEYMDGTGFPAGLRGDDIPLPARIICVANEFDNATTRGGLQGTGLPVKEVLIDMGRTGSGRYDDAVIQALLVCHRNGTLFEPSNLFDNM